MNASCLAPQERLDLLQQLFAAATGDASVAMCRWTDGIITLSLDEVREIPLADASAELSFGDELLTMIVLCLDGEVGGQMILTFDEKNGRELAASLLDRPVVADSEWTEWERSALNETGNILGCAYLNALTRLIGVDLVPTPPYFVQDYGASVLQQALVAQAAFTDTVLVCRTGFHRKGEELNWRVVFVPNEGMRAAMEKAMHRGARRTG
jgi:chemotaxis protein CheC